MILFLGFLFPMCGFGFGFWFGLVPIMQCQFSLIYQVHHQKHRLLICCAEKAQFPPVEQTIAPHLLASFPETSANCQEKPNWVARIGRPHQVLGTPPPPCGGRILRWHPDDPAVFPAGRCSSCSGPCSEMGAISPNCLLVLGSSWLSRVALVCPSLCDLGAGPRSV